MGADGAPETTLNLSFTYTGLAALGVDAALLATFPEDFREGMAARAHLLGDVGESAPEHWEAGLGTGEAHVLVTLYGIDEESLERAPRRAGGDASTTPSRSSTSSARRPCPRAATISASRTASPSRR